MKRRSQEAGVPETNSAAFLGRMLMIAGVALVAVGALLVFLPRLPLLGRLPGDLVWTRGNLRVYLPITTSLLISLLLTGVLSLIALRRR
jgi:hypothetical protein